MFAGKKSAQIREILISESAWEEMTCLFAPSLMLLLMHGGGLRESAAIMLWVTDVLEDPYDPEKAIVRIYNE